jgi:hypothetical protein
MTSLTSSRSILAGGLLVADLEPDRRLGFQRRGDQSVASRLLQERTHE